LHVAGCLQLEPDNKSFKLDASDAFCGLSKRNKKVTTHYADYISFIIALLQF